MNSRMNKRDINSKDNEYSSSLNQKKAKKLMGTRPYSVADNFRMDDRQSQQYDEINGKLSSIRNKINRGTGFPSTSGAKVKLELSMADNSHHISSIATITPSLENQKYIGLSKHK